MSICIVDPDLTSDINATNYTVPDFGRKTLVSVCIEIDGDGILKSVEGTEIPGQVFSYIRGLHKHSLQQADTNDAPTSSSSVSTLRGGKTFVSIMRPVLLFVRYRTSGTTDDIVEDLSAVMALESFIQLKRFPGNNLSQQMMCMPSVAKRVKMLKAPSGKKELDLIDHEFDQTSLEVLNTSQR